MKNKFLAALSCWFLLLAASMASAADGQIRDFIYNPGTLKPVDSSVKVVIGQVAPDFSLPSIGGRTVSLSEYRGKNNVVLSFIPAAWTPVCSAQWPGYNIGKKIFTDNNAVLIGITEDNIPSLHAWVQQMGGLWFDVLSDFWPHGRVADAYGVLRTDGTAERALFFIDTEGIIRAIMVTDINVRPPLEEVMRELVALP
jgi:peroxiredoxin